jgi:hypothetical protein
MWLSLSSSYVVTIISAGLLFGLGTVTGSRAQSPDPNYDESNVPDYTLPEPLTLGDGTPVQSSETWWQQRRPQLLEQFKTHVYGELPPPPPALRIEQHSSDPSALDGAATRRQVTLHFTDRPDGPSLDLLIYRPNNPDGAVPVFAGLNFAGNHTVTSDPGIRLPTSWVPDWGDVPSDSGRATEEARGARQRRWPVEQVVEQGHGLVTAYYGDLFPDRANGFEESIYQLNDSQAHATRGQWSAISAWAWGLHRMMDYATQSEALDADRVLLVGHSRLGKAALWAGATDRRFAGVIDNASGCGGSALFRRRYGERIVHIDTNFPHWFCDRFSEYRENESTLPVDQHQLLSLIAPRPLLVSPKTKDRWADPKGMFLSARHAAPVWEFLGHEGLDADSMPAPDTPVLSRVGFFLRTGEHDLLPADWSVFLDFADKHVQSDP